MPSYVVTGASRGIGFEIAKQLSADPSNIVFGLVRNTKSVEEKVSEELPGRKNLHIVHGDLTDDVSMESAAKYVAATTGGGLDVLIACAAALTYGFTAIDEEYTQDPTRFDETTVHDFKVNVLGNIHLLHIFTPLIKRGSLKKVIVLSSGMADAEFVAENSVHMQAPYAISKAALNMAVAKFHVEYKDEGILFMCISPGLADTGGYDSFEKTPEFFAQLERMGGLMAAYAGPDFKGPVKPEVSAKQVLGVIENVTIEKHGGKMFSHLGTQRWL